MGVFIISEIGSSHGGSLETAKTLAQAAAHAGADACKIQFWSQSDRLAHRRNMMDGERYEPYRVPREWLDPMAQTCKDLGIEFMSTVYLPEDIPILCPYVKRWKIASFEAGDADLVAACRRTNKQVIVSLGMGQHPTTLAPDVRYLHCVSGYPTPDDQANIARVRVLHGYSDHTISLLSGALATACGAEIIEKHLKSWNTPTTNPDAPHALVVVDLQYYIGKIREAEALLGDGSETIQPCEAGNARYKVQHV